MTVGILARQRGRKKRDFMLPRFIFMTDDDRVADAPGVVRALPAGAGVIVRSRNPDHLKQQLEELRPICTSGGVALLAAADPRTALSLNVDGVHLSEDAVLQARGTLRKPPRHWIVTASAHSATAVLRARRLDVDGILISPVFATRSHPGRRVLGTLGYRRLARYAPEQACPLGGVTPETLRRLRGAPVAAICGIDLFLGHPDLP